MAITKPIAGFPSRTEAVQTLKGSGLTTRQVADRLGLTTSSVAALYAYRRSRRLQSGRIRGLAENGQAILVSNDILDALDRHATRRGISAEQLVRDLLGAVVDDGIVDAVLDDGCDAAPEAPARRAA